MQLILSQFKNRLRPAYTVRPSDFHTVQFILIDYTAHTGGKKKETETESPLLHSLELCFLYTLVRATFSIVFF